MSSRNAFGSILIIAVCWALSAQAAPPETASSLHEGTDDPPVRLPAVEPSSLPEDAGVVADGTEVEARRSALVRWWNYQAKPHLQASHWGYPEFFGAPVSELTSVLRSPAAWKIGWYCTSTTSTRAVSP
jgi:hypothetical protein